MTGEPSDVYDGPDPARRRAAFTQLVCTEAADRIRRAYTHIDGLACARDRDVLLHMLDHATPGSPVARFATELVLGKAIR